MRASRMAKVEGGRVVSLGEPVTLEDRRACEPPDRLGGIRRRAGIDLAQRPAIAFAGPVGGEMLKLTNNPWVIRPALIKERLGVDRYTIVNDFGAVAYAVATLGDDISAISAGPSGRFPTRA